MRNIVRATDVDEPIHASIRPADVRPGDPIRAQAVLPDGSAVDVPVWRVSPIAIELVRVSGLRGDVGDTINLRLLLARQVVTLDGLRVASVVKTPERDLVGLTWRQEPGPRPIRNRREQERFTTSSDFAATLTARNPLRYADQLHMQVCDISARGMGVRTSLRNKHLVPGLVLDAAVHFPTVGDVKMKLRVVHARTVTSNGKEKLAVGLRIENPGQREGKLMGQYLLQTGDSAVSLQTLRQSGLSVQSARAAVNWGFVSSEKEYREVLALRKLAYSSNGKLPKDLPLEQAGDAFDGYSRIVTGRYRGQVVASARLTFPGPDDPIEHEQFFALPAGLPPKERLVEISRVCTHPAFRGSDLLLGLCLHFTLTIMQSDRTLLMFSSTAQLVPFYKRTGARLLGQTYKHTGLGGDEHHVFVYDVLGGLGGSSVGPLTWNATLHDICEHLSDGGAYSPDPVTRVRLAAYRAVRPLVQLLMARMETRSGKVRS